MSDHDENRPPLHAWGVIKELWNHIEYSDPEPTRRKTCCWFFKSDVRGSKTEKDPAKKYGKFMVNGRPYLAHHVALEIADDNPVPPDLLVRHLCDRPACMNPAHLLTGTPLDNARDAMARKRTAVGERNGAYTHPEKTPRGIRHHKATIAEETAASIKWCLFKMAGKPGAIPSIAAHYKTTYGVVTGIL